MIARFGWDTSDAGVALRCTSFAVRWGAFLGVFFMTKISEMKYFRINILAAIAAILVLASMKMPRWI